MKIGKKIANAFVCMAVSGLCMACGADKVKTEKKGANAKQEVTVAVPEFDADSAYQYVKEQVDFGPRVPNMKGHVACGQYLADKLEAYGAQVYNQFVDLTRYDGQVMKSRNIIGAYRPELKKRVALFAHWDTRPWADKDADASKHHTPILGANDGASGVGVLLEIARQLQKQAPAIGIDIVLFDAEDSGAPDFYTGTHQDTYWCLGSQYWSRIPHTEGYHARFGILLDMVGGKGARFYKEAYSLRCAKSVVNKVWQAAAEAGYGSYFIPEDGGGATDDHLFVNEIAGIPTVDIIPMDEDYGFGAFWHTVGDNMEVIDRATLKAVGQTLLHIIYNEK